MSHESGHSDAIKHQPAINGDSAAALVCSRLRMPSLFKKDAVLQSLPSYEAPQQSTLQSSIGSYTIHPTDQVHDGVPNI